MGNARMSEQAKAIGDVESIAALLDEVSAKNIIMMVWRNWGIYTERRQIFVYKNLSIFVE